MQIQQMFLTKNNYSRPGTKRNVTSKIAIHYVGNALSKAINNRNYFEGLKNQSSNNSIYASSHYIIGLDGEIIQCVPDDEIAYTTNSANAYSIGIECCHLENGTFTKETRRSLVELVCMLLKKYHLNENDIIRHFDVTGKLCPICWAANSGQKYDDYLKFKLEVKAMLEGEKVEKGKVNINGKVKEFDIIMKDGRTFIDMAAYTKELEKSIEWDGKTKTRIVKG